MIPTVKPRLHSDDFPNLNRKARRALLKKLLKKQKEKTNDTKCPS